MPRQIRLLILTAIAFGLLPFSRIEAQSPADRTAIGVTVLSVLGKHPSLPKYPVETTYFEPLVLRGMWTSSGAQRDTFPSRNRDSVEVSTLSKAFGVKPLTTEINEQCAGRTLFDIKPGCTSALQSSRTIAISDPRLVGDTAIVLLRTGPVVGLSNNNTALGSRQSTIYLIKLLKGNVDWGIWCATVIGGDGIPRPQDVEARCRPSN